MPNPLIVRQLGLADYAETLSAMQAFTHNRGPETTDEIWMLEHPPVFTLGVNADEDHIINAGSIPVVRVDRGGQVTYHGPGQLVAYLLLDLARARLGVKELVCLLEQSIIETLAGYQIQAHGRDGAPGVYVDDAKIASVGLRIRHNRCYHGLSINVSADLEAFTRINPCGYKDLNVTRTMDLAGPTDVDTVAADLLIVLLQKLGREQQD